MREYCRKLYTKNKVQTQEKKTQAIMEKPTKTQWKTQRQCNRKDTASFTKENHPLTTFHLKTCLKWGQWISELQAVTGHYFIINSILLTTGAEFKMALHFY